jgi:hypothetical protein
MDLELPPFGVVLALLSFLAVIVVIPIVFIKQFKRLGLWVRILLPILFFVTIITVVIVFFLEGEDDFDEMWDDFMGNLEDGFWQYFGKYTLLLGLMLLIWVRGLYNLATQFGIKVFLPLLGMALLGGIWMATVQSPVGILFDMVSHTVILGTILWRFLGQRDMLFTNGDIGSVIVGMLAWLGMMAAVGLGMGSKRES